MDNHGHCTKGIGRIRNSTGEFAIHPKKSVPVRHSNCEFAQEPLGTSGLHWLLRKDILTVRAANDDTESGADERPGWLTESLVEQTLRAFRPKTSTPLSEADAVRVILSLSQLLEATGLMKLENNREGNEEEVHGLGTSKRSGTGA
jgi:hypothetical protein